MSQFTLYENTNEESREAYPYFVDIQNALLDSLNTRLVIPLTRSTYLVEQITHLCPTTTVDQEKLVLLTHQMTDVPVTALQRPKGSLEQLRVEITSAPDFLITGI